MVKKHCYFCTITYVVLYIKKMKIKQVKLVLILAKYWCVQSLTIHGIKQCLHDSVYDKN